MLRIHPALSEVLCELIEDYRELNPTQRKEIRDLIEFERTMQARGLVRPDPPARLHILGDVYIPAPRCHEAAITAYELLVEAQIIDTLDATYDPRREPCVTYWVRYTG